MPTSCSSCRRSWRTPHGVVRRPDVVQVIARPGVLAADTAPRQPPGRWRFWVWVAGRAGANPDDETAPLLARGRPIGQIRLVTTARCGGCADVAAHETGPCD